VLILARAASIPYSRRKLPLTARQLRWRHGFFPNPVGHGPFSGCLPLSRRALPPFPRVDNPGDHFELIQCEKKNALTITILVTLNPNPAFPAPCEHRKPSRQAVHHQTGRFTHNDTG